MTAIGKIESFDETQEKWETYVERVEQFFSASNIDEDHQVPTLLKDSSQPHLCYCLQYRIWDRITRRTREKGQQ